MQSRKMVEYSFPELDSLVLIGLSDLHLGSPECHEKKLIGFLEKWGKQDNVRFVLAGDLIDNGLKQSKTECLLARLNPLEQVNRVVEILEPYADKILLLLDGNHEGRTLKETAIRIGELICLKLGIPDKFCTDATGYLKLSVGLRKNGRAKHPIYSVAVHHGASKGKVRKAAPVIGCDLMMVGHTHQPEYFPIERMEVDLRAGLVNYKRTRVTTLTSWLQYGGYGEEAMYCPSSIAPNRAILYGGEHDIEVVCT